MSQQRLSVREAAELLGISPDGVRMRIKRGSMESERDDEGRVWVWLETANSASQDPNSVYQQNSAEAETLRDEVAYLRSVISQRDSELERAHRLLGESLSQLRALNAPEDAPASESSDTGSSEAAADSPDTSQHSPQQGRQESPQSPPADSGGQSPRRTLRDRLRALWRGPGG